MGEGYCSKCGGYYNSNEGIRCSGRHYEEPRRSAASGTYGFDWTDDRDAPRPVRINRLRIPAGVVVTVVLAMFIVPTIAAPFVHIPSGFLTLIMILSAAVLAIAADAQKRTP